MVVERRVAGLVLRVGLSGTDPGDATLSSPGRKDLGPLLATLQGAFAAGFEDALGKVEVRRGLIFEDGIGCAPRDDDEETVRCSWLGEERVDLPIGTFEALAAEYGLALLDLLDGARPELEALRPRLAALRARSGV